MRDLRGTVEREKAALGILITLRQTSEAMKKEAVATGVTFKQAQKVGQKPGAEQGKLGLK